MVIWEIREAAVHPRNKSSVLFFILYFFEKVEVLLCGSCSFVCSG